MILLDANYILRYLLQDNEEMFREASATIENKNCYIPSEVLAEVVYVLTGHYEIPRDEVAKTLQALLFYPNLHFPDRGHFIQKALQHFKETSLDYVDCLLCAMSGRYQVATFDKKLQRCLQS